MEWQQVPDAMVLYAQVRYIIRDGFTDGIESTVRDYSRPKDTRLCGERWAGRRCWSFTPNPPVAKWMAGYREVSRFGSPLDGELRGAVILCRKEGDLDE